MTEKRFSISSSYLGLYTVFDDKNGYPLSDYELLDLLNEQHETITDLTENLSVASNREISKDDLIERLRKENEQLKAQLYCDNEEGVCNICKHHYLVKDDEIELGYYNSRCRKGHYECARVSMKHCKDFEKELEE